MLLALTIVTQAGFGRQMRPQGPAAHQQTPGYPVPDFTKNDFVGEATKVEDFIKAGGVSNANCQPFLTAVTKSVVDFDLAKANKNQLVRQGHEILSTLWGIRLALHDQISAQNLNAACVDQVKTTYRTMRAVEDYVGEFVYPEFKQVKSETLDFQKQPTPLEDQAAYPPYHLNPQFQASGFHFQTGDIMITKGVSFLSSTISAIPDVSSQYSHIVFVNVNEKTGEVRTLESYVGPGFDTYAIDYALKNENARILVLRPKNQAMGKDASDRMMNRLLEAKSAGKKIPYDYNLDFKDHSALSCAEVAEEGFEEASGGSVILPMFSSEISLKNPKFLHAIGLKQGHIFTPIDVETDPRFDVVLEWRDQRLMRDSRYKDAVMHASMTWMNERAYQLHSPLKNWAGAELIGFARGNDALWAMTKKLLGVTDDIRDVPVRTLIAIGTIKAAGEVLLNHVYAADAKHITATGWPMTNVEIEKELDVFRAADLKRYVAGKKSQFHQFFRPPNERDNASSATRAESAATEIQ